jgi:Rab3 GTPase-activating protein catalytic subunit
LQNAAAKAERVLTEIKADIKADFGRASTPDNGTRHSGKFHPNGNGKMELPWTPKDESEKCHEAEFKTRILELSKVRVQLLRAWLRVSGQQQSTFLQAHQNNHFELYVN